MAEDLRSTFAAWRTKHARRAWKPVCVAGTASLAQFGGSPVLAAGERWPACAGCDQPMQFFLQFPLASLPASFAARGAGILQLFYCSQDDGKCETWRPFSGTHLVRVLTGPAMPATHPTGLAPFPVCAIEQWQELSDYPQPAEHDELGLVYDYDVPNKRMSVTCGDLGVVVRDLPIEPDASEAIAIAAAGDKLGGWPMWVQDVEYPVCPQCDRRMELVFQVDSEDNIPYLLGDLGCGHITPTRRGMP